MLEKAQFWQRSAGTPMSARQIRMLNHVLDGMKGKLANAQWAAMSRCSADTALHNTNDLVARGGAVQSGGRGRDTEYLWAQQGYSAYLNCLCSYRFSLLRLRYLFQALGTNSLAAWRPTTGNARYPARIIW